MLNGARQAQRSVIQFNAFTLQTRKPGASDLFRQMVGIQTSKFLPKYHNLTHMYFNLRRTKQVRQIRHRPVPSNRLRLKRAYKKHFHQTCSWLDVFFPSYFFCCCLFVFINRLPATALQENFPSLLGVLKESVQLNLAPPGYFLLLRYRVPSHSMLPRFFSSPGTCMFSFLLAFSF